MIRRILAATAIYVVVVSGASAAIKPPPMPRCHPHDGPHIPCRAG